MSIVGNYFLNKELINDCECQLDKKPYSRYCFSCNKNICILCKGHKGHNLISLESIESNQEKYQKYEKKIWKCIRLERK